MISQRYLDGQEGLFPEVAEGFNQLLVSAKRLVGINNDALALDIECLDRLLTNAGDERDESPLTIGLKGLIERVQMSGRELVDDMVDMAKADALDLLGETRQGFELVDRHV